MRRLSLPRCGDQASQVQKLHERNRHPNLQPLHTNITHLDLSNFLLLNGFEDETSDSVSSITNSLVNMLGDRMHALNSIKCVLALVSSSA